MDRLILSPQQQAAVAAIVRWYRHDRCHQQVARSGGMPEQERARSYVM